jgi:hypothetical protein
MNLYIIADFTGFDVSKLLSAGETQFREQVVQADVLSGRLLSTRLCFLSALSVLFGG